MHTGGFSRFFRFPGQGVLYLVVQVELNRADERRACWDIEVLPDGSTRATSPDGLVVLCSHGPPPTAQPSG